MAATVNLASKYAAKVDEKFTREAFASHVTNNEYSFTGVQTVQVFSVPVVDLADYSRQGTSRYGTPGELGNSVQEMKVTQDRAWTFTIDRGNKAQTQMVMDAGKAVARQLALKVIPEFDTYVISTIAKNAGGTSATAATKSNAYELFLNAQEALGNKDVPDSGRVCLCSYKFANFLKQDPAFMRYGDTSQKMLTQGVMGEVDGCKIVKVPASRLPVGCSFLLTHPLAAVAPRQLSQYKIHTDPPGISGWLCEGRILYDCFVLNNKKDAIWYQGTALS